jgi:hypothetical protein
MSRVGNVFKNGPITYKNGGLEKRIYSIYMIINKKAMERGFLFIKRQKLGVFLLVGNNSPI